MAKSDYVVRLRWPSAAAFASPEALERALAERAAELDRLLRRRSRSARSRARAHGPRGSRSRPGGGSGAADDALPGAAADFGMSEPEEPEPLEPRESWSRAGAAHWRGEATRGAAREIEQQAGGLARVDRDVAISVPPPETPADPPPATSGQLERIGLDRRRPPQLSGEGVRIAVVDSGLDAGHPDFEKARIAVSASWDWYDVGGPKKGVVQAIRRHPGAEVKTRHYHGTAVAGLLAGQSTGVAPGSELVIHNVFYQRGPQERRRGRRDASGAVHASDSTLQGIQSALIYSVAFRCDLFVLSLGAKGYNPCFEEELSSIHELNEEALVVVAAGNYGPGVRLSPGDYAQALTVGAVDWQGEFWPKTSGARIEADGRAVFKPEIYAPGHDLRLPVPLAVEAGGFSRKSGTSFATPIVAGVAALVLGWYRQRGKTILGREVREHLLATADDLVVPDELGGKAKRLNAAKALAGLRVAVPT